MERPAAFTTRPASLLPRDLIAFALYRTGKHTYRMFRKNGYRVLRQVSRGWLTGGRVRATNGDTVLNVQALDNYSAILFLNGDYEPDMLFALWALRKERYVFVDAGANVGYWSAVVSSPSFGGQQAIAIEASAPTFADLHRNAALNGGRFVPVHAAVAADGGRLLEFDESAEHAIRRLRDESTTAPLQTSATVASLRLDAIIDMRVPAGTPLVVKLDLEGGEPGAFDGMVGVADRPELMVIAEDRADESAHLTVKSLQHHAFLVWALTEDGKAVPVRTDAEVAAQKALRRTNFAAHRPDATFAARYGLTAGAHAAGAPVTML